MPLLSKLQVGSLLIFPTHGTSDASHRAQRFIRYDIKQAKPGMIEHSVTRLRKSLADSPLAELLLDAGLLVPVPGSAPLVKSGLWVPERICVELVKQGIGQTTTPLLERTYSVPKSSGVTTAAQRPSPAQHYASLQAKPYPGTLTRITLVDDVVTRGSTLIACASRLQEMYPDTKIEAFALARTDNHVDLALGSDMVAAAIGNITFNRKTGRLVHKIVEPN